MNNDISTLVLDRNYMPLQIFPKLSVERAEIALQGVSRGAFVSILDYPLQVKTSGSRHSIYWPSVIVPSRTNNHRRTNMVRLTRAGLYYRDHGRCQYCGEELSLHSKENKLTIDHVIPTSRGGTNDWNNVSASCDVCNRKKGNKPPEEFGWPKNKPYEPTYYQLLTLRSKYPLVIDDPRWMAFLPPWTGPVHVRYNRTTESLRELFEQDPIGNAAELRLLERGSNGQEP